MIIQQELKKVLHQLVKDNSAQIELAGSTINLKIIEDTSIFSLSTPVYFGGNFIPKSVRNSLSRKNPRAFYPKENIKTQLTIDELNFRVFLIYLGSLDNLNGEKFKVLLEEFSDLAEDWRLFLDENDKNDLIHVRVK